MARVTIDITDEQAATLSTLAADAGHGEDVAAYARARLLADADREISSYRERLLGRAMGHGPALGAPEKTLLRALLRIE